MSGIRVYCRFRPKNRVELEEEKVEGGTEVVKINGKTVTISGNSDFTFDSVFPKDTTQEEVFKTSASPIIEDMLKGYNCTLFVYGQTGSGKSWSMSGEEGEQRGIIPRMVERIFEHIYGSNEKVEFTVCISYVEIYLEKIRDLLDPEKENLKLRHGGETNSFLIQGVTEKYIGSCEDALGVIEYGTSNRSIGETRMNQKSSRSHSLFMLTLTQETESETKISSKLVLVDLAGSEKVRKTGATGIILKQAQATNKSLTTLGMVIRALNDGSAHIPYRDSKLTRILSDSLGGNSKTCLIITCSPSIYNVEETVSTLRFGGRVKNIKNKPKRNIEKSISEYKKLLEKALGRIKELEKGRGEVSIESTLNEEGGEEEKEEEEEGGKEEKEILLSQLQEKVDTLEEELAEKEEKLREKRGRIEELEKKEKERRKKIVSENYRTSLEEIQKEKIEMLEKSLTETQEAMSERQRTNLSIIKKLRTELNELRDYLVKNGMLKKEEKEVRKKKIKRGE